MNASAPGADGGAHPAAPGPVAVDAYPALLPSGGIGRYVGDVVHALAGSGGPAYRLVHPKGLEARARERFPGAPLHALPFGWRGVRLAYASTIPFGVPLDGWFGDASLYHATMGVAPVLARIPLVLTVHDLTAIEHPEWHPAAVTALTRATLAPALARAALVACDSEHVRRRVLARFPLQPERVRAVPLALSPGFAPLPSERARSLVARTHGLDGPFVLHVGTWEPRKNHASLLRAFDALVRDGFPGRLVLVGRDGWRCAPLFAQLEGMRARDRVVRVTDADDTLLAALYAAATMFVFPSLDEGFGLPLLEAMAQGCPSVCSDGGSLPEVAGDAARVVPATDPDALAATLVALARDADARAALADAGRRRAGRFAFAPWAERMRALYAEVARAGRP